MDGDIFNIKNTLLSASRCAYTSKGAASRAYMQINLNPLCFFYSTQSIFFSACIYIKFFQRRRRRESDGKIKFPALVQARARYLCIKTINTGRAVAKRLNPRQKRRICKAAALEIFSVARTLCVCEMYLRAGMQIKQRECCR
jgi:hypothetical protein